MGSCSWAADAGIDVSGWGLGQQVWHVGPDGGGVSVV